MRRFLLRLAAVLAALAAVAALYTLRPVLLGERIPVAQVVALKGLLAAGLVGLGVLLAAVALAVLLARRSHGRHASVGAGADADAGSGTAGTDADAGHTTATVEPDLPAATAPSRSRTSRAAVVLLVSGVVTALAGATHGLTLMDRGTENDELPAAGGPPTPRSFTVLTLNTLGGASTPVQVAEHATTVGADVLALPETSAELAGRIEALLEQDTGEGWTAWTDGEGRVAATSMVVADALGPYEQRLGAGIGSFGRVHLEPTGSDPDQPVLVAAHPLPPVRGNMTDWRAENLGLVAMCERAQRPTVIAGDLNMSVDHRTLSGVADGRGPCQDAGLDAGIGGIATWPASWPTWAGSVIDHVLVAGGLRGAAGSVDEVGGSDHRAVVTELRLTGGS